MPAPPIWDGKGNLWGTTTDGGTKAQNCTFGCGVIFAMTPNGDGTWTYHVAHRFAASAYDGQLPYGSLVMDAAGNFYGSTWLPLWPRHDFQVCSHRWPVERDHPVRLSQLP
jgi:hypothetical protein